MCVLWRASRLKVRSKATVLTAGWGCHYLWVVDMREKWNPLSDPNDVFFRSEKSKHVHCSVMWPNVGSQSGHCRKGLCFNYWSLTQHICWAKLKRLYMHVCVGREVKKTLEACRLPKNQQIRGYRSTIQKHKESVVVHVSKFSAWHSVPVCLVRVVMGMSGAYKQ